jgi:four helix bundle protein
MKNEFKKHLIYATGSLEETKVWLMFAKDCNYLSKEVMIRCLRSAIPLAQNFTNFMKIGNRSDIRLPTSAF